MARRRGVVHMPRTPVDHAPSKSLIKIQTQSMQQCKHLLGSAVRNVLHPAHKWMQFQCRADQRQEAGFRTFSGRDPFQSLGPSGREGRCPQTATPWQAGRAQPVQSVGFKGQGSADCISLASWPGSAWVGCRIRTGSPALGVHLFGMYSCDFVFRLKGTAVLL
jgi:hypothetical protein